MSTELPNNPEYDGHIPFNPHDAWDVYIVDKMIEDTALGYTARKNSDIDKDNDADNFALAAEEEFEIDQSGGFGWNAIDKGVWVEHAPDKIPNPEVIENYIRGMYRAKLEYLPVSRSHSNNYDINDVTWAVRLIDQEKDTEFLGCRFSAEKLSTAVAAAIEAMPDEGKQIFQTESVLLEKDAEDLAIDIDKNLKSTPNLKGDLNMSFDFIHQIEEEGSVERWLRKKLHEIARMEPPVPIEDSMSDDEKEKIEIENSEKESEIMEKEYELLEQLKDLKKRIVVIKQSKGNRSHESDGWMDPPDWRG